MFVDVAVVVLLAGPGLAQSEEKEEESEALQYVAFLNTEIV